MPQFTYKAKASPDEIKTGIIEADNQAVAIKAIRENGLFPIYIKEQPQSSLPKDYRKINTKELSAFTRQLANLVRSGFPLSRALSTLSSQNQNINLKKIIKSLEDKIENGFTFSQALSLYPKVFSDFYINMIKIGEAGGRIDHALERLAGEDERAARVVDRELDRADAARGKRSKETWRLNSSS